MDPDEEDVMLREEHGQLFEPSFLVQDVLEDQIVAGVGLGLQRAMKAIESGAGPVYALPGIGALLRFEEDVSSLCHAGFIGAR